MRRFHLRRSLAPRPGARRDTMRRTGPPCARPRGDHRTRHRRAGARGAAGVRAAGGQPGRDAARGAVAAAVGRPPWCRSSRGGTAIPDGTFELSFGYFNVNTRGDAGRFPWGPTTSSSRRSSDGHQPTRFEPVPDGDRRHWGAFTVTVPADFGDRDVVWTLHARGQTLSVPGRLTSPSYELAGWAFPGRIEHVAAVALDAGRAGRARPAWDHWGRAAGEGGDAARSPRVGDTRDAGAAADLRPINTKWFKHQGPGDVTFTERTAVIEPDALGAGRRGGG